MTITALPTPPSSLVPSTFNALMDAFLAALPTFQSEANALAAAMTAVAAGGAVSLQYTFSTTTTDSDPGAGKLRLNQGTQNTSTVIRPDLLGSDGSTYTGILALLDDSTSTNKGYLMLRKATDATKWLLFTVASTATPSGYYNITATCVASSAASPFADGDALLFDFTPTGDAGATGATGAAGVGVPTGGQVVTTSVTLTASSGVAVNSTINVAPATPGLYMTLPVATGMTLTPVQAAIEVIGDYDYGTRDSAGTVLGWVRPRTGAAIGLANAGTAAGTWAARGLEKLAVTAHYFNPSATNTDTNLRVITLDTDRTCFLFGGTTCYALIYNATTQAWGTATSVRTSLSTGAFVGVKTATDKVMVCSCNTTTGFEAVMLTISGTGITVETGTKHAVVLAGNFAEMGTLVAVPSASSFAVSYGRATTVSGIRAITTDGTTPAIGAESALVPATTSAAILFVSGSVLRTVSAVSGASGLSCKPYTVSTNTLSAGTAASATTSNALFRAFLDGNGNIVCNYRNSNHSATIFKLTSTTEAASSAVLSATDPSAAVSATEYLVISANKTLFWSSETSNWYANILTGTSGTASAGTAITGAMQGNITTSEAIAVSGNTARVGSYISGTAMFQFTFDCSGTSPTLTSIERSQHASTPGQGAPAASDKFGVRQGRALVAGTTKYILGSHGGAGDTVFGVGRIDRLGPLAQIGASYLAGATAKEAFCFGMVEGNTVGFILQRVECAP